MRHSGPFYGCVMYHIGASPSPYRFPSLIHDLKGFNILKPDSNKGGEVGQFDSQIQDPKATTT